MAEKAIVRAPATATAPGRAESVRVTPSG
jgi:hypothetical protein